MVRVIRKVFILFCIMFAVLEKKKLLYRLCYRYKDEKNIIFFFFCNKVILVLLYIICTQDSEMYAQCH